MDEAEVYIKAGLKEGRVNGKAALLNPLIKGDAYNCRNWYGRKHPEFLVYPTTKIHFDLQSANLLVKPTLNFGVVQLFLRRSGENLTAAVQELILPLGNQVGMDPELVCQLAQRVLFSDGGNRHLRLKLRRKFSPNTSLFHEGKMNKLELFFLTLPLVLIYGSIILIGKF